MSPDPYASAFVPTPEAFTANLAAAGQAPSPDNNQPWAFAVEGDLIRVLHIRSQATGPSSGEP